jgi:hypothetical protein
LTFSDSSDIKLEIKILSNIHRRLVMQSSGSGIGVVGAIIYLLIVIVMIASGWKLYVKAGKPGWAVIIPIYNIIVLLEIVKRPIWWIILLFIPLVNIVVSIILMFDFLKAYGRPGWHFILLLIPLVNVIYYLYLGFSADVKYVL